MLHVDQIECLFQILPQTSRSSLLCALSSLCALSLFFFCPLVPCLALLSVHSASTFHFFFPFPFLSFLPPSFPFLSLLFFTIASAIPFSSSAPPHTFLCAFYTLFWQASPQYATDLQAHMSRRFVTSPSALFIVPQWRDATPVTLSGLDRGDDDRSRREELQQDRHAHVLGRAAFLGVDGLEDARVCGEAARD